MPDEITFMVGGEAGQGVQSVGFGLAKVFSREKFHVFCDQDYESRIRGGRNFFRIRANRNNKVGAINEKLDMLIALNEETIGLHRDEIADNGVIIYDNQEIPNLSDGNALFGLPLVKIAEENGGKIMSNSAALGAAFGLLHFDFETVRKVLLEQHGGGEISEANVKAARAGYDFAVSSYKGSFKYSITPPPSPVNRMLINGTEAISLGAIAAGCKFVSAYPMTPTTPILEYLSAKADEFGIAVIQPEDEISAINMAVGAGYAGVRAMTATSGSGFCLMVEGLGLSGITETPVVIIEGQRPGPAVGLPTRSEQGDLQFVINAHQGDFPRAVFAPVDSEDAFWITVKAFNIAEKYQIPVIILTDHYQATCYSSIEKPDLSKVTIDRGLIYDGDPAAYKRHKITENGISPRAFPGLSKALVVTDSDEHDESGHLIEDAATRTAQMQKRLRKIQGMKVDMDEVKTYGPKRAETTLIGWGSTYGALQEAVDILRKDSYKVNLLQLNHLWPFPVDQVTGILNKISSCYVVENNASGQLTRLIREQTGIKVNGTVQKFDGRPFTPAEIVNNWKKEACC